MDNVIKVQPFNRALEVRKELSQLSKKAEETLKEMAELLYECFENEYHKEFGYASFYSYVEAELDVKPRKASFYVSFTKKLKQFGVDWKEVEDIGWRKLGAISSSMTQDNYPEMIELARSNSLTQLDYQLTKKRDGEEVAKDAKPKRMVLNFDDDEYQIVQAALEEIQKKEGIKGQSRAIVAMSYQWYMAYCSDN